MDFSFMGFHRFSMDFQRLPRRMLAAQESTDEILHDLDSMVRAVTWPKMLDL